MPKAPVVIHQYGRQKRARMPNGDVVEREDRIYVRSYKTSFPTLEYDNHFIYYDETHIGSTIMCTCGSSGAAFAYDAYKKYCSYQGERVLGCVHHLQYGNHADGST